ncbi:hypothetical protein ABXT13_13515, partial [Staphylococcus caprae]|uniref:hypothetical protein n=1 Tax=Staphylococcus caprae TaxID=29380 RepID=UPI003395FD00
VRNERLGVATVAVDFDVVEVRTGENIKAKRIECEERRQKMAHDDKAAPIDGRALLSSCYQRVVDELVKAISPWQDVAEASFR